MFLYLTVAAAAVHKYSVKISQSLFEEFIAGTNNNTEEICCTCHRIVVRRALKKELVKWKRKKDASVVEAALWGSGNEVRFRFLAQNTPGEKR